MQTKEYFEIGYYCTSVLILAANVYYIATGPRKAAENAVRIGRNLNNEQQKDNAKRNLFLLLFSLRGNPVHYDFVRGLNQIDVVFSDSQIVLNMWHIHYDSLNISGQTDSDKLWDLQRTNLLSEMAVSLGYDKIRQTDMLQNYTPVGHNNWLKEESDIRQAQLVFYKSNAAMATRIMERMDDQDEQASKEPSPEVKTND